MSREQNIYIYSRMYINNGISHFNFLAFVNELVGWHIAMQVTCEIEAVSAIF